MQRHLQKRNPRKSDGQQNGNSKGKSLQVWSPPNYRFWFLCDPILVISASLPGFWKSNRNTQKHSKEGRQTTPYNYDGGDPDHHPPPLPMVTSKCEALGTNIRIINPERLQRFEDHEGAVTDLSWSHTNFFISGSLDKTVRLWHPSRRVCFSVFKYSDPVTSKISIRWRI